jgi:hypothetical protein
LNVADLVPSTEISWRYVGVPRPLLGEVCVGVGVGFVAGAEPDAAGVGAAVVVPPTAVPPVTAAAVGAT